MIENRQLERPQLGGRVEPEIVAQCPAQLGETGERVGRTADTVEEAGQTTPRRLAIRVGGSELFGVVEHAERITGGKLQLDAEFVSVEPLVEQTRRAGRANGTAPSPMSGSPPHAAIASRHTVSARRVATAAVAAWRIAAVNGGRRRRREDIEAVAAWDTDDERPGTEDVETAPQPRHATAGSTAPSR